ncbi:MAG: BtaA family protein [Polyangiaceae bacterium]|nr:BtaA family protein [Polyangiaceae bacterium]
MRHEIKFAVVREDAELEAELVRIVGAREALVVASGGCTALTLCRLYPSLRVTAFDLSVSQLEHLVLKADAAERGDLAALNVGTDDDCGLNQRGAFEGLFRLLRGFLIEFVTGREELESFFLGSAEARAALLPGWQRTPYWAAAFRTAFCDPFLGAMFGPAATQHAAPGSYGLYFEQAFSRGLAAPEAHANPFLQHVLLGRYLEPPAYARGGPLPSRPALVEGSLLEVSDLARFDVVSLSNVFDWSDDALCARWGRVLARQMRPGSAILLRQLNNERSLRPFFDQHFRFDDPLARALAQRDRSLFYNRFEIAFREAS